MARSFRIRLATVRDIDLLVRHRRAMWSELGTFRGPTLDAADVAYRRWVLRARRDHRIVGFIGVDSAGTPVGSQTVWLHEVEPSPGVGDVVRPMLSTIYVEPRSRKKGVGRALVRAATNWCREAGYPYVTAIAVASSRPLLSSSGYQRLWEMGKVFGKPPV
jgi:GNAT superfamily N-acetyltransferase